MGLTNVSQRGILRNIIKRTAQKGNIMKKSRKQLHIRLPTKLYSWIAVMSYKQNRSMSNFIVNELQKAMNAQTNQVKTTL